MNVAIIPLKDEPLDIVRDMIRKTKRYVNKIIVVDSSREKFEYDDEDLIIIREKRHGKGIAIRRGIDELSKLENVKNVVFIDSDGERDPDMIPKVIEELEKYEIVVCSRSRWRSFRRKLLNYFSRFWVNVATGYGLRDPNSGYLGVRYGFLKKLNLSARYFEIEMDFILNSYLLGRKVGEVVEKNSFFSPSKFKIIDLFRLNYFFDSWCIRHRHVVKRKAFLLPFAFLGYVISKCLIKFL